MNLVGKPVRIKGGVHAGYTGVVINDMARRYLPGIDPPTYIVKYDDNRGGGIYPPADLEALDKEAPTC